MTPWIKCHTSIYCLQHFCDRFKCCGSEDIGLFASCLLEHKINRIWQHDYCITPLTRFNSQTGDNKIMDGSVFYTRSMWALFSIHAADIRPSSGLLFLLSDVKKDGEDYKGQFTAGGLKCGNSLTPTDKRKRSFTEVNFTILCYVGVFLVLTNGTN